MAANGKRKNRSHRKSAVSSLSPVFEGRMKRATPRIAKAALATAFCAIARLGGAATTSFSALMTRSAPKTAAIPTQSQRMRAAIGPDAVKIRHCGLLGASSVVARAFTAATTATAMTDASRILSMFASPMPDTAIKRLNNPTAAIGGNAVKRTTQAAEEARRQKGGGSGASQARKRAMPQNARVEVKTQTNPLRTAAI